MPKSSDARQQRLVLDRQIDTICLSIYPTFVEDFNALLRPNERLSLKKDELLNAQMRIFILIRLGITHNEVIAQILDYSVNTVYSYKTRVIAASDLTPDAFYDALMRIPSFT
jgi:DNA-binding NarL/FixJ family response regulator